MNKQIFKEFITYNLVGIVNTLFGFSIIFFLMFAGVDAKISNMIGYGFGAILSYYLNKKYTFKATKNKHLQSVKFFAVLGIAYLLNFFTLEKLLPLMNPYVSQLIAAIVYTLSSFLLAKFFVFKT